MPSPTISFRTVPCEADIVAIRSIVTSSDVFRPDEIDVAVELIEERLRRGIASGYFFVFAEEHGSPIGYTCFGPIACTVASHDLFWIAVAREYHGKKIGSALMDETEKHIRTLGGKRVYIETSSRSDYLATRGFYQRHGYAVEATIKNFYDDNDDKVIYSKELSE
ncbi:MAG: GNAT family N-acetyltransferase [Chitinispirillaceae bacterium]|nr:GNAT family N-acetyltransferase [Chitinispirillaceae bacterium]